jgi:hypothetical protein
MALARLPRCLFAAALVLPGAALAQSPFDMSIEQAPPAATTGQAPPALSGPQARRPFDMTPEGATPLPLGPPSTLPTAAPEAGEAPTAPAEAEAAGSKIDRYLISSSGLRFDGEMGRRSWGFVLTAEQASRPATLVVAHNSAIHVAPEYSRLKVAINERPVIDTELGASGEAAVIEAPIPAGVLRSGANAVTFEVTQRHRTDCTVASTYDLWTTIEGEGTGLVFEGPDPTQLDGLRDLPAVGFDGGGTTRLRLIAPGAQQGPAASSLARLVQAVVLRGNFRHAVTTLEAGAGGFAAAGNLRLAVGPARDLAVVVADLPPEASSAPTVAIAGRPGEAPLLIVSGPGWREVEVAIDHVAEPVAVAPGLTRAIDTTPWLLPEVPLLRGAQSFRLGDLGVPTTEFSGRRFHAEFFIGLPGDFYSGAYGEATLYLDAAYTGEVLPGSHIDVYVNGYIAANTPLTSATGDIVQHLPIKVAMTHFRPGVNQIAIEAVLETEADLACAPGAPGSGPERFALFDTSVFEMPAFGRIQRWPDLSALVGDGSPYAASRTPIAVVLSASDRATFAAALDLLARIAISAGRVIPVDLDTADVTADRPAIFVGPLAGFNAQTVAELGIDGAARTAWPEPVSVPGALIAADIDPGLIVPNSFGSPPTTSGVRERWQNELVSPSGIRGRWQDFERWLERTFDLSLSALSFGPGSDPSFSPPDRATLMIAQAPGSAARNWTMLTAPGAATLARGVAEITERRYWAGLNGRIATFDPATGVETVPARFERLIYGGGFSLNNVRLVAANWLSGNILVYAVALVILCVILGVCTSALLSRLGRQS